MVTRCAMRFPAIGACHGYLQICLKTEVVDILGGERSRTLYCLLFVTHVRGNGLFCCWQRPGLDYVSQQQSLALHAKAMAHFIILLSRNIF